LLLSRNKGSKSSCDVHLNGKHLAHHDGGYSTWRVDITNDLKNENLLFIAVDNSHNEKVYPQVADFTFYGGLYRDVNIVCVSKSHFSLDYHGGPGLKITPDIVGKNANVHIETWITNFKEGQNICYSIYDKEENEIASTETDKLSAILEIENVHLWHGRKDPCLYKAEVKLVQNNEVIDCISSNFGCRTFKIDSNNGFILNGKEYPLRGVSRHQDRLGYGNALLPSITKRIWNLFMSWDVRQYALLTISMISIFMIYAMNTEW
jgi:beta-galactosidase